MTLDPQAALDRLGELLATAPLNLVSKDDRRRVRELHIAEGERLVQALGLASPLGGLGSPGQVLDLGSGGGLPGLVIAILRPHVRVTCLDARAKKMRFVQRVVSELGLVNVNTVPARAEAAANDRTLRGEYEMVVSRAVGRCSVVAELGRGFLMDGGRLIMVKGPSYADEIIGLRRVTARLSFAEEIEVRQLQGAPRTTYLVGCTAEGPPPSWIPRADGLPASQPLEESIVL
jgi:16S rRNA (guanine527-N7)-methyltransferase